MAPAVAEARQLALAAARVILDRELGDPQVLLRRPDDHLGGELHPGGPQVQPRQHVAAQGAHAAVGILDPGAEEQVEHAGEQRIADVAVQPGHRSGLDVVHAVAHHELGAVVQLGHEAGNLVEVVREIGVRHHDVVAARRREAGEIGTAVSAARFEHHPGTGGGGDLPRAVLGGVVGDDHLPGDVVTLEHLQCGAHARLDVAGLVEARDDNGHERRRPPFMGGRDLCLLNGAHRGGASLAGRRWHRIQRAGGEKVTRRGRRSYKTSGPAPDATVSVCPSHARLRHLRLPVPVHRRRWPSAGTATWPSVWSGRVTRSPT